MTSPSMVHRSGDTLVVRSVVSGNQLFTSDTEAEADQFDAPEDIDYCDEYFDPDDNKNLPECKIRRNYSCVTCHFFTQNPRHYLYHLRDVHKEKVKIYECSNCLYASKHFQKLLRHVKMVHASTDAADIVESQHRQKVRRKRKRPVHEDIEPDAPDEDTLDNLDEDQSINGDEPLDESASTKPTSDLKCSLCFFTTKHQGQLTRHEKQEHIKTKFFRCSKCSYVTHIKARFTKHVKYHSMPMIKCDLCDFRTPYKWNLDRHYKNHNGHGAFRCSACNFTADIKQSLTVHEMNHHVPPVGQAAGLGVGRRRNKVGASDTTAAEEAAAAAAQTTTSGDTLPTMPSGLVISGQPRDFSQSNTEKHELKEGNNTNRKSSKLKISLKKFKSTTTQEQNERHNFDTDFIHPDDIIHHSNGNIYIKNKCKLCNFKTAWDTEMAKHERKVHNILRDVPVVKKIPRPIPNLIPIQNSLPSQQQTISVNSLLKIPMVNNRPPVPFGGHMIPRMDDYTPPAESMISQKDLNDMCAKSANSALRDFASLLGEDVMFGNEKNGTTITAIPAEVPQKSLSIVEQFAQQQQPVSTTIFKKKNASFFDKLKEKLMTGESCNLTCKWCGHESKCLSESAGHQKSCGKQQTSFSTTPIPTQNVTSSTRCQYCRQRCKSSIDLHNHLQVCTEAIKQQLNDTYAYNEKPDITIKLEDEPLHEDSLEPHPMENVVFVWNNISPQPPEEIDRSDSRLDDLSIDLSMRVRTPESESSFMESENIPGSTNSTPAKMPTHGTDIDQVTDGRRVFKCPHCSFWATTASRFHVHIVGHLNKKPFECSLCAYRSNWRWDITKHIRLKSVRDPEHEKARVLMTDETGRRNYSKYNKYLTQLRSNDSSSQDSNSAARKAKSQFDQHQGNIADDDMVLELPKLTRAPNNNDFQIAAAHGNPLRPPPPLKAANEVYFQTYGEQKKRRTSSDSKKTLFKCKKCNFRDASRENILSHVKGHYRQESSTTSSNNVNVPGNAETDEASVSRGQAPFRCGHCHQVSNWKHVIQRHCRLKHSGDVRVVIGGKNGVTEKIEVDDQTDEPDHMDVIQSGVFRCKNCPFSVDSQTEFDHHLEMHIPRSDTTMKCYFCPYYVAQKYELFDHLRLHGVMNPEDYVNRAMQGRDIQATTNVDAQTFKRYKCVCCPYVSNSKSQFLYHKQFHRHRGGPFKCEFCSYNVTRRHLLHQHLKVHGVNLPTQKSLFKSERDDAIDCEDYFGLDEIEEVMSPPPPLPPSMEEGPIDDQQILLDVPLVWVSKEGKFSKMFKCRFCPHVNMRKVNIQEHEKMHSLRERNPNSPRSGDEHHCTECSYICNNAGVLSSHLKVHQMVHGQIHCLVDTNKTDEEQISELTRLLNVAQRNSDESSDEKMEDFFSSDDQDLKHIEMTVKMLYFCENCPARFLHEKELHIHKGFHGNRQFYRCDYCTYAARQRPHLLSHGKVHTEDYQEKTKYYLSEYPICKDAPQPKTVVIFDAPSENNAPIWVVISHNDNKTSGVDLNENNTDDLIIKELHIAHNRQSNKAFGCRKCPARFFKNDALKYHMTLHGCSNPYKCKYCDYAARTSSNLQKHHRVHEQQVQQQNHEIKPPVKHVPSTFVPISGTDLFQQKSEAQRLSAESNLKLSQQQQQEQQQQQQQQHPLHIDPQFGTLVNGNPKFVYPTYLKNGRMKEKRYKCHKCPSAFEKREQYKVHLSLHGSKQRYNCENCDYSVKYYANYIQHIRKHQQSADALQTKKSGSDEDDAEAIKEDGLSEITSPPFSKLAIKTLNTSCKRGPLKLSVADRQTFMILQKRRVRSASSSKESTDDKKLFWCPHCPYTSYRKDAVDNHVNRHICVSGVQSNYTCEHCDYTVPQTHFLREHVKMHFMPQKNHQPEAYLVSSEMELSTKSVKESENSSNCVQNESVIFKDNGDKDEVRFTPNLESDALATNNNNDIKNIYVNPITGEFTEDSAGVSVQSDTKEPKKSQ